MKNIKSAVALLTLLLCGIFIFAGCNQDPDPDPDGILDSYTVTVDSNIQNGTITANPASGISGTSITLTIVAKTGFQLKDATLTVKQTDGTDVTVSGTGNTRTFTMPASNVTVNGEFEAVAVDETTNTVSSTVEFSGFGDETIDLTMDSEGDIHLGQMLSITVKGEYDSYDWLVDGNYQYTGPNQFSVYSSKLGLHSVTVAVTKGGIPYSKELTFRVVRGGTK